MTSLQCYLLITLCVALSGGAVAQEWPEPGAGFEWENVGDREFKALDLAFDDLGRLWAIASDLGVLDDSGVWTELDPIRGGGDAVLPLGVADTVFQSRNTVRASFDGGQTWVFVLTGDGGGDMMLEVPWNTPPGPGGALAGDILTGYMQPNGIWRSQDRGVSWAQVEFVEPLRSPGVSDLLVFPTGHLHAGRLLAGTFHGAWIGTTINGGPLTMRRAMGNVDFRVLEHLVLLSTGRVVATGYFNGGGTRTAFYSDDGGETWTESMTTLPEPSDGIPGSAEMVVIGSESVLAIGSRGIIYQTDDGAETWRIVGRAPVTEDIMQAVPVEMGPDGRMYVGLVRAGPAQAWVVRTVDPVVVASASPPEASGASLCVEPNPSSGAAQIRLSLISTEANVFIRVFDARGREVSQVTSGARGAGEHAFEVNTSTWASGVYVVRAEIGNEVVSARFTVIR